jgi:hypothetical protein
VARAYSVRIAAVALDVSPKWVDNVLSQHEVPGVVSSRQGVERSISDLGIRALELIRIGSQELGMSVARSVEVAIATASAPDARFATRSGAEIRFELDVIDRRLRERLVDAIEATPRLARGRPRTRE